MIWAIDNDADGGPALQRLTRDGKPLWSQTTGSADLVLGPTGGVVYSSSNTSPIETFELFGFDGGLSWQQAMRLGTSVPFVHDVAVDPTGAIYAAGQVATAALPLADAHWPNNVVGVEALDPQGRPQGIRAWATGDNDS